MTKKLTVLYNKTLGWQFILAISISVLLLTNCKKEGSNSNPECEILKPAEGDIYLPGEEITISINASDPEGKLKKVDLYINDQLAYTFYDAPYEINWKSWGVPLGDYSIKVMAIDETGKETDKLVNIKLKSGIAYDNILFGLDLGALEYYGKATTTSWNFDITLLSGSVISNNIGNVIFLEAFSPSSTDLVPGEYNFDAFGTGALNTFDYSDFAINYDFNTSNGISGKAVSGHLIIDKSGNIYKIFINTMTNTGKPLNAYYEGSLQYIDRSVSPGKSKILKDRNIFNLTH